MTTSRKLSFEQAKSQYVHRYTMEHVPDWARKPVVLRDGTVKHYAPHYRTDREWYDNTYFNGEHQMADRTSCYSTNNSWPLGQWLDHPYSITSTTQPA